MDVFIVAILSSLTPQTVVAFIGGFIGANISSDIKLYGLRLTILTGVMAVALSGAVSEYIAYKWQVTSLISHFGLGGLGGMAGMRLLDALRLALPDLTYKLINLAGKSSLELVELLFKRVKKLLGF